MITTNTQHARQRLNLTAPSGEQLFLTQLSDGAKLTAEGSDNSIDIIGEETNPNNPSIRLMSGTTPILNIHSGKLECYKRLYMNNNPIYVRALDTNHSIGYSSYKMDGVQISGFGDSQTPFFRVRSSNGDVYVIEVTTTKVNIYKDLFLEYHLNVSGSTRLGNNVRVDNLEDNQTRLDLYCAETGEDLYNHNSLIRFLRTNSDRASLGYYAGNDKLSLVNKEGDIEIRSHTTGSEGGRIDLKSNGTIDLSPRSNNSVLNLYNNGVKFYKKIQWYDGTSEKGYARFYDGNFEIQSVGCDLILGKRGSQSSPTIVISDSAVNMTKSLCFTDSNSDNRYIVLQGNDIRNDSRIIGYDDRIDIVGKSTSTSNAAVRLVSGSTSILDIYSNKVDLKKNTYIDGFLEVDNYGFFKGSNDDFNTFQGDSGVALGSHSGSYGAIQIMSIDDNGGWIDWVDNTVNSDLLGRIRYNKNNGFTHTVSAGVHTFSGGNVVINNEASVAGTMTATNFNVPNIFNVYSNRIVNRQNTWFSDKYLYLRGDGDMNHWMRAYNSGSGISGHDGAEIIGNGPTDGRSGVILGCKGRKGYKCLSVHYNQVRSHVPLFADGGAFSLSDDRFKTNEIPLTNSLATVLKLQPEIYTKTVLSQHSRHIGECPTYTDENGDTQEDHENWPSENYTIQEEPVTESGFIAQDTYNNVPELRHLVSGVKEEILNIPNNFNENGSIIENIVDSNGEPSYLSLNYIGLIPYLVGAIKELNTTVQTQATLISELQSKIV